MICKRCFRMSDDGFEYCPYCGKSFKDDSEIEIKPEEPAAADGGESPRPEPPAQPRSDDGLGYGAARRPDNVPQGQYGGGYYYNGQGYTMPPPFVPPVKKEKTPTQKFFSAIGHAALYFLLFFLCQIIVTTAYMTASSYGVYSEFFEEHGDAFNNPYLSEEDYNTLEAELAEALSESLTALDYNIISMISSVLTIVALVIVAALKNRPFSEHTGFYPVRTWKVALLFPLGIAVQFLTSMVINLIPWSEEMINSFNTAYENMGVSEGPLQLAVEIIAVGLIGPLVEELVFRGCVYTRLRRGMPTAAAVILSALAFGIAHGVFIAVCYATVLGLMLAYTYTKFESVLAPFVLHMGFNLANYIPLLREDSSDAEVIITLVISAVVTVACASVIILSDVSRKKRSGGVITVNDQNGGNIGQFPPQP